jgi:hypothetical chaperone protein
MTFDQLPINPMFLGIDFGTTNTVAAVMDGSRVRVLPLEPSIPGPGQAQDAGDSATLRTMLYIEREGSIRAGADAIRAYREQNVGRVPRYTRQWVGEIEIEIGELNVKGYDVGGSVTAIVDAFADVDADAPGRLIHALKGPLATHYKGTRLFGKDYSLEALIAEFLMRLRSRIGELTGRGPRNAVFGRPVHFANATTRDDDTLAQARLLQAAQMAGFERVVFETEPVGAALAFGAEAKGERHVLVFDFGGGTLDVAVVRFAGDAHEVLATGGIGIGGDAFDQAIFRKTLLPWFGSESRWGDGHALPAHLMESLGDWQDIPQLATAGTIKFIREAQRTSTDPLRLLALEELITKGYAYDVYEGVQAAKVALSTWRFAVIAHDPSAGEGSAVSLWQPITRAQFESIIARERRLIGQVIDDTVQRAGVVAAQIDHVVRTGGSSSIPVFVDMLADRFGREKIVAQSLFTGVASGLAVKAAQLNLEC